MKGSHFPALHLSDEISLIQSGRIRFHAAEDGMQGCGVVVRAREGDQLVLLGVVLRHGVCRILVACVIDLHGMHVAGEQADVVDIARLAEGVGLDDERPCLGHEGEHVGFLHGLDFGMLQEPRLIQAVDQEIRPAVGAFHAEKHGYSDLLPQLDPLFIIREVEFDSFLVGLGFVAIYISVDKVIGNENARIAQLFVIFKGRLRVCRGASAHGVGMEMGLIQVGLHRGTAFRVVGFSIA